MQKKHFVPLLALAAALLLAGMSCKLASRLTSSSSPTPTVSLPGVGVPPDASTLPKAVYLGQGGGDYAGEGCAAGAAKDNVHLRLTRLRENEQPVIYRMEDGKGSVWANPCESGSSWMLVARPGKPGEVDLYFKPRPSTPKGTRYLILIRYQDGVTLPVVVESTEAIP